MEYIHMTRSSRGWNIKNNRHRLPIFITYKKISVTSTYSCLLESLSKTEAGCLYKHSQLLFSL